MFFCHLAKSICSDVNVIILIPCCYKKERFCSCLLSITARIVQSVPTKFCCVYTIAAESRTCLKSLTMANSKHLLLLAGENCRALALPWFVPRYVTRWHLMQRNKEDFFIIRTKITSAQKYEASSFSSVMWPLSQILQPWQESNALQGGSGRPLLSMSHKCFCTLLHISLSSAIFLSRFLNLQIDCCFQACYYVGMPGWNIRWLNIF